MPDTSRIHLIPRSVSQFSDDEIARLVSFGRQEAELLDQLELAGSTQDASLAMQIARALYELREKAQKVTEK